ncbi:phenylacetaldoxime dehydratase family protein [Bradyrhizobium sp. Arg237L]|uniref:phenylacetaldoxime dehydratase family protein n=1 Tax=Bradyrhizobium sp. Arg237L TaxID=3003352 RepID=UPI00249E295F|nr:phenylacetaldoxime dehydratase family protein [Bradyrhizobium sp. Arg237L]MDI4237143.1 phenylacetaldoxime dehydratase family protein [Bradyrhizobium sp. Arg237L]
MVASDIVDHWRPRTPVARVLAEAPTEVFSPAERVTPLRKPPNFKPAVQRWSFQVPPGQSQFRMALFGAEAPSDAAVNDHPLLSWIERFLSSHPDGPNCLQHARSRTLYGTATHLVSAYWVNEERFARWMRDEAAESWWQDPARLTGPFGTWREILRVPRDRQESLFWLDFPIGVSASAEVALYPTPYCGYYGAMRDRLLAAAKDKLESTFGTALRRQSGRIGFGEHWAVQPPKNIAIIRGGSSWGFMDQEQHANYEEQLRGPVSAGMDYLERNALPSGCACMRWQRSSDIRGHLDPDEYAHAYFLSLQHLEDWSENHASHAAIFSAAIRRYRHYGAANQLRTWHEVYVLPEGGHTFEYLNCHPDTGLLSWFDAKKLR